MILVPVSCQRIVGKAKFIGSEKLPDAMVRRGTAREELPKKLANIHSL